MGLSYDIISEFVKVTNGNKEKPKEGIVYATIVQASDGKYVKIDGSDLLTPTDTTTDIEDGERVTVMIKDHRATVTGNVTAPSASGNRVDKVVETVTEQIGVFETVVADKVSTNELEAYKATIEHLIAGKAEIEDLEATNAEIENLKVKNAEIENAVIDKATIEDLEAVNAVIENLKVKDAEIENLVADKATINDLNAVNADIQNLKAQHAHIEDLVADKADIEDLEATNAVIENLKAKDAEIENLVANKATIEDLEATKAEIEVLDADFAEIKTLVSGNLTSDNILSFNITADKVTMEDAFIKDAMIDTVNAAKINAGRINTNSVVIGSEDGGMRISGATQQFTDKNGNVRIQIGRDASNDFTFALYGEDGQGQIINQNGITASAIADGLIVNDMVSDNAAISGGKLDISSVVTEINNDNTTTIKSNKIYLDEQNQSLEVAFKSLKTQVDTIKDIDSDLTTITDKIQSNTSKIEANKSSISTLLAEDAAIKKQVTDLEGNVVETTNTLTSKYTSLQQNLDGFKTTVNNTYATKTSVNDVKNNLSSNYSTTSAMNSAINQKVDEISASISSTYATKNEVKTIDDNIKANYSTTEQMSSAISVAKDEINLGISKVYETKTEVSNKIGDAISKVQIGGRNYLLNTAESVTVTGNNGTNQTNYFYSLVNKDPRPFRNKKITFSADYELSSDAVGTFKFQTNGKSNDSLGIASGYWTELSSSISISSSSNRIGQIVYTRTMSDSDAKGYTGIGLRLDNFTGTITIKNAKFEIGDKNTSWTPAVEDIDADISSAITTSNEYTDSQIKISKDAIELGVSQTYETKSSVSSQISSTLTSAKSYADTKKSEAISTASSDATTKANNALTSAKSYADTKKTEAINSANSTLNTTIANYYTKTQTDSQIKVAKDAINLGVSQTYETKTNVTSKVNSAISTASSDATSKANNALNSAKSYADTKKSEAITSANNTLNTTIANYYTKTQTDSQIKIAKDAINLGVSETYETKTNVTSKVNSAISTASSDATSKANNALNSAKSYADTKKSEAITSANNTLNNTIANYYTKAQTDSQINIAKDAIDLSVKNTYETKSNVQTQINNIQVGGTNLVRNSDFSNGTNNWSSVSPWEIHPTTTYNGKKVCYISRSGLTSDSWAELKSNNVSCKQGESYTMSVDIKTSGLVASTDTATLYIWSYDSNGGNRQNVGAYSLPTSTDWTRYKCTGIIPSGSTIVRACITIKRNGTVYATNFKLEKGNKATEWSPAPEDINTDITTKTNNALNSAKSYADTKKTEAINSANSTLNTTIANYYTKAQTDSQIKIAKDAITSSVSSTYETKTNVQNKIDAIKVGGRNLWLRTKEYKANTDTIWVDNNNGYRVTNAPYTTVNGFGVQRIASAWTDISQRVAIESNTEYTLSAFIKWESQVGVLIFYDSVSPQSNKNITSQVGTSSYKRVSVTFNSNTGTVSTCRFECTTNTPYLIYGLKLEKGNKATDWSPAPEDVDNTISSLSTRVSTAEQKITDSAIVSTVTSSTTYKNNLTGKVDKTTIISSINQTAESVKINASKIELTGSVVVNAINGGSTLINGSKIQTGTLSANTITSGTFQGTNFIAGGSSNGNGYFQVKDSSNNVKFHASKNGVYATTMSFPNTISVSGAITQSGNVYANSNGFNVNGEETGTLYRTVYTSQVGLSGITTTEQSYNTSNGGNVAGTKYTTKITGYAVNINGSSLRHGGSGSLEVGTSYGYVRLGPANSDRCHFNTDRSKFWFEKPVYVSGEIYAGSGYNKRVYHQGYKPTPADIGAAKALVSANGYQGLVLNDGSTSNWIRTTVNGLIPYQSGGHGSLGTSSWPFQNLYANNGYINEVKSISSSASLGLTGQANVWITSGTGSTGSIFIQSPTMKPASGNTTNLGDNTYKWKAVYSNNGTIQTSDERFKVKQGFVDVDECYAMIKDIDIYNYIMLSKNKEELSKSRLGKLAMSCKDDDVNIHIGVMAQDIQKYNCSKGIIIKNVYRKDDGTTDTQLSINPYSLTTAVMGGLQKEISIRDEQYEQLKRENEELKSRLSRLEQLLIQTN